MFLAHLDANYKSLEKRMNFLSYQAASTGHKIVRILNMSEISLPVMQDSVKCSLFH